MIDKEGHIVELQSIRGCAALLVVFAHATSYFTPPAWFAPWQGLFNGHAAVIVFFLLSGYVLTLSLRSRLETPRDAWRFYVKRAFRIYPALWVASVLGLYYLLHLHEKIPVPNTTPWFDTAYNAGRMAPLYYSLSFLSMAFILPQLWTIFIEIVASIFMPLVAWAAFKNRPMLLALFLICLVVSFTFGIRTYYGVGVYLVDFVIGASFAVIPLRWRNLAASIGRRSTKVLILISLIGLIATRNFVETEYNSPAMQLYEAGWGAVFLVTVLYGPVKIKLLRTCAAAFLGDISYSLYLLHIPVLFIAAKYIGPHFASLPSRTAIATLMLTVVTLAVCVPLSWLSYRFVELPGIRAGTRFLLGNSTIQADRHQAST